MSSSLICSSRRSLSSFIAIPSCFDHHYKCGCVNREHNHTRKPLVPVKKPAAHEQQQMDKKHLNGHKCNAQKARRVPLAMDSDCFRITEDSIPGRACVSNRRSRGRVCLNPCRNGLGLPVTV